MAVDAAGCEWSGAEPCLGHVLEVSVACRCRRAASGRCTSGTRRWSRTRGGSAAATTSWRPRASARPRRVPPATERRGGEREGGLLGRPASRLPLGGQSAVARHSAASLASVTPKHAAFRSQVNEHHYALPEQLSALLAAAGFEVERLCGGFEGEAFDEEESEHMVYRARLVR